MYVKVDWNVKINLNWLDLKRKQDSASVKADHHATVCKPALSCFQVYRFWWCQHTVCCAASFRRGFHLIGYGRAIWVRAILVVLIVIPCATCWHASFKGSRRTSRRRQDTPERLRYTSRATPTVARRQPIPLQVELWEDWPGNHGGWSEGRLDGVVEDLLEARRPQLARVEVPHRSPARTHSVLGSFPLSVVILSEVIFFYQAQMSYCTARSTSLRLSSLCCCLFQQREQKKIKCTVYINEVWQHRPGRVGGCQDRGLFAIKWEKYWHSAVYNCWRPPQVRHTLARTRTQTRVNTGSGY